MTTTKELADRAEDFRKIIDAHLLPGGRPSVVERVSADYAVILTELLWGGIWRQPGLADELRSIATITAQCVNGKDFGLQHQVRVGLTLGMSPQKIKYIFVELQFYAGIPASVYGLQQAQAVINERDEWMAEDRRQDADWLPTIEDKLQRGRELRRAAWGERADAELEDSLGRKLVSGAAQLVDAYLYGEIWARSPLTVKERMVMVLAVLMCRNHLRQLRSHIGYALDAGLSRQEICEVLAQAGWYRGWPYVEDALHEAAAVFAERDESASSSSAG